MKRRTQKKEIVCTIFLYLYNFSNMFLQNFLSLTSKDDNFLTQGNVFCVNIDSSIFRMEEMQKVCYFLCLKKIIK